MYRKTILLIITIFFISSQINIAQDYVLSVENQTVTGNSISFDLYIRTLNASDTLFLASSSWGWYFNNNYFNNPAFSVVDGFTTNLFSRTGQDVGDLFYSLTANLVNGNKISGDISAPIPTTASQFNQRVARITNQQNFHRIGRYKLSGITNPNGYLGLDWWTQYTVIWGYQSTSPFNTNLVNGILFSIPNKLLPVSENVTGVSNQFDLKQNYPNPFNPVTRIMYVIPVRSHVEIIIFNNLGMEMKKIVNETIPSGYYSYIWDASSYPAGVYYCKMISGNFSKITKLLLIK